MNPKEPYIIEFNRIGKPAIGYVSVAEKEAIPFTVKRIYWTYYTPEDVKRGGHAHLQLEQILLAVSGKIIVKTELLSGHIEEFILDKPSRGLFLPKMCWREMSYSHNSVQVCIASMEYSESDYVRNYEHFKKL